MDKEWHISTEQIQRDGKDSYHFHRYEPTPYEVLDTLFHNYPLHPKDHFVDYGCGLGRLNFYLERTFGCESTGIEYAKVYYDKALQNLESFCGDKKKIHFVHELAEEYVVDSTENIFYFFNPFSINIFRKVVNQILNSYYKVPRTITIILYYPEDDVTYYLANHTDFSMIDEIAACDNVEKDRRERFCIWRITKEIPKIE